MYIYFPSCNFNAMCPETANKLRAYLEPRMPVAGCCRVDKNEYSDGQKGLYLCQACREVLEPKIKLVSLWTYLDEDPELSLPDYSGLRVIVQDCWRDRNHAEIHSAVRSLLGKMNIEVAELEGEARERSIFCGDLHYEPRLPENVATVREYAERGEPLFKAPPEVMARLMREQAEKFAADVAVTYCNRCTRTLRQGGANAVHLLQLVLGDFEK